jgi:PhnB protein
MFKGNAREAFNFYKLVFGGEFATVVSFKDMPSFQSNKWTDIDANKIMYIALPIGKSSVLMANDVPTSMGQLNENENRSKISINSKSKEEADKLFYGVSVGGQIEAEIGDSPWGAYFGMFRDKYGIEWMLDFDSKMEKI